MSSRVEAGEGATEREAAVDGDGDGDGDGDEDEDERGRAAGVRRVPAPAAEHVEVRFASLDARDRFDPEEWQHRELAPDPDAPGWFLVDVDSLGLPDGAYEYEFVVHTGAGEPVVVPDPYAEELVRFGGYRGVLRVADGRVVRPSFSWDGELSPDRPLAENNELVVYELPLRWTAPASPDYTRQISLGDFDHLLFEHLDYLEELGVNAIELLPVQDSSDTLNWGYGTRFFLAPDVDMGTPVDTKFFVKECHRRGIRVLLDVVMNHALRCPLERLAPAWFFLDDDEEPGRPSWGGRRFRYRDPVGGAFHAREFHYRMAEFWVREYHLDGFRIDEFRGIDHWEFVQAFRERAWAAHRALFPDRPFLVVAEDSWRRATAAKDRPGNPNGRKVVDAIWNFAFRDDVRRLLEDRLHTEWGEPSRTERVRALVSGRRTWDDLAGEFREGFDDLSQSVNYVTSHDVEREGEQRFMNDVFGTLLRERGLGDGSVENVRYLVDRLVTAAPDVHIETHREALDRVASGFALLLTSVGVPMFLAGEEFADVHDLEHTDWRLKMSDPVDWRRRDWPGHAGLRERVRDLVHLRTSATALGRNEVEFTYVHPEFDADDGVRVFAYCRTDGRPVGEPGQVVVVANVGPHAFESFDLPWSWGDDVAERGARAGDVAPVVTLGAGRATLSLAPFQVRVFET